MSAPAVCYEDWWAWAIDTKEAVQAVLAGDQAWSVLQADAEDPLPGLPPQSVDAVITDPPAGISFMDCEWDSDKGGEEQWIAWLSRCMAHAFAALKPGGHAIVWALPRTSDWTALALRRAGFEIRDSIHHSFASGFPKSLDVSKTIDAFLGAERDVIGTRKLTGKARVLKGGNLGGDYDRPLTEAVYITAPATDDAKRWTGWGTALKPAHEVWWVARKPLCGTVAANVLRHGTGGINVDSGRLGVASLIPKRPESSGHTKVYGVFGGGEDTTHTGRWPANLVFSHVSWNETTCACGLVLPFVVAFCPACGSGEVEHQRGGCRCVGERKVASGTTYEPTEARPRAVASAPEKYLGRVAGYGGGTGAETIDAWECLATCDACGLAWLALEGGPEPLCECGQQGRWACPVAVLDAQSGERASGARAPGVRKGLGFSGAQGDGGPAIEASEGGASRFFHCFAPDIIEPFFFSAKPSTSETEAGCEALPLKSAAENVDREEDSAGMQSPRAGAGRSSVRRNHHPTKKSFALLGHFCDLFLPPGGVVLDPFGGSGTLAAVVAHRHQLTGWRAIVGEISPEYVAIGRARAKHWGARRWRPSRKPTGPSALVIAGGQRSLFGEP